jgi:hypothetical protein
MSIEEKGSGEKGGSWPVKLLGGGVAFLVGIIAAAVSGLYLEISVRTPTSIELTSFADLKNQSMQAWILARPRSGAVSWERRKAICII